MGYGWSDGGMGIGTWVLMALVMILLWGGVVAFVIYLVRRPRAGHSEHPSALPTHHDAERILNERFARGEIDEAEFIARRTALRGTQ
jgi:putative membrane protein